MGGGSVGWKAGGELVGGGRRGRVGEEGGKGGGAVGGLESGYLGR